MMSAICTWYTNSSEIMSGRIKFFFFYFPVIFTCRIGLGKNVMLGSQKCAVWAHTVMMLINEHL